MNDRRIDGFFYGLFMDDDVLRENQVQASNPRRGYVEDYALHVGQRATLVPTTGARAYGMVYALTHDELERLYSAPGLGQYRPEAVLVQLLDDGVSPALCYNLPETSASDESNAEYARRLRAALSKLGFPMDYVSSVS